MYVRELHVRYRLRRVAGPAPAGPLTTPADAARFLGSILRHEPVEVCGVVCLSTRHEVLAYHELSRGTLDMTFVQPRDVFRTALLANARAVIVGHNHPSGDVSPSPDDRTLSRRLTTAGEILGVDLVDHLIVSIEGRYYSFRQAGWV